MKYVLSGSGHIAGVVNPPAAGKYQYWTNDNIKDMSLADWIKGAEEHKGSWWPDWREWLGTIDTEEVPARKPAPTHCRRSRTRPAAMSACARSAIPRARL